VFTAIAATAVLLPWAIDGIPVGGSDHRTDSSNQTELTQQPLTGLGAGVTVREVRQATPFSMVALTAADLTGTSARVRAKRADGLWGPWYKAAAVESGGSDAATGGARGTEPVFVGRTNAVQIAITRADAPGALPAPTSAPKPPKPGLGYMPANIEQLFG
jgi:uncharacterized protein with LGFP repeats